MSSAAEEREKKRFFKLQRMKKSGLRKCPNHWINKRMNLKNTDVYDNNGQCGICGGFK